MSPTTTLSLSLALLAGALAFVIIKLIRVSRMEPAKRAELYRSRGIRQPDARTYLRRRFLPWMGVLSVMAFLFVALSTGSPSQDGGRETVRTAIVVLLLLSAFGVMGRLTYKRLLDDQRHGLIDSDTKPGPW